MLKGVSKDVNFTPVLDVWITLHLLCYRMLVAITLHLLCYHMLVTIETTAGVPYLAMTSEEQPQVIVLKRKLITSYITLKYFIKAFWATFCQHLTPLSTHNTLIKVSSDNKMLLKGANKGVDFIPLFIVWITSHYLCYRIRWHSEQCRWLFSGEIFWPMR